MRLGIGTAQFGLNYGISNTTGRVSVEEVGCILERAAELGIEDIDTAAGYGESEAALGNSLGSRSGFRVVTKTAVTHPKVLDAAAVAHVIETFHRSLDRLRLPSVDALLVHRADDLLGEGGRMLWNALEKLREKGLCRRLGVSLSRVSELESLHGQYPMNVVQIAINVFDQRWPQSGWPARLRELGVEIHVRSVFLQGLLLMDQHQMPAYFAPWQQHLAAYAAFRDERHWSPLESAVRFIRTVRDADCVFFGVQAVAQLEDIRAAWTRAGAGDAGVFDHFALTDERLLNPACWKLSSAN